MELHVLVYTCTIYTGIIMPCLFFFAQLHKPKFRPDLDSLKHSNMFFCAIDFIDLKIHVLCFDFTSFYIRPLLTTINEAKIKTWWTCPCIYSTFICILCWEVNKLGGCIVLSCILYIWYKFRLLRATYIIILPTYYVWIHCHDILFVCKYIHMFQMKKIYINVWEVNGPEFFPEVQGTVRFVLFYCPRPSVMNNRTHLALTTCSTLGKCADLLTDQTSKKCFMTWSYFKKLFVFSPGF